MRKKQKRKPLEVVLREILHPERLEFDTVEPEDGWVCAECGTDIALSALRYGDDPTPECDHCAHSLLARARTALARDRR